MHPVISYELPTTRIAGLRPAARRRGFGEQLWTLLHAQALLDGSATATGSASLAEDDHRRFATRRNSR